MEFLCNEQYMVLCIIAADRTRAGRMKGTMKGPRAGTQFTVRCSYERILLWCKLDKPR